MTERSKQLTKQRGAMELVQFRLLLIVACVWFFGYAIACRITGRKPQNAIQGESCTQVARRLAYGVVPYAFMRV
jgi:hypothetical protein